MNSKRIWDGLILSALVVGLTGCGQGFLGSDGSQPSATQLIATQDNEVSKIQTETESAELAMAQAQEVLDGLIQNDQLTIPTNLNGLGLNLGSISGIPAKLEAILDKVYDRLLEVTARAKDMLIKTRAKIVAAMAGLNPNDPKQAEMLAKLQQFLDRLDQLENRLDVIYGLLADKVNLVVERVDQLIARLDNGSILGAIIVNEVKAVRDVLVEFRDRLANT